MKKIILITILIGLTFSSCIQPVLEKNEYLIVDTLHVSYNGFGQILGYHVIVKYQDRFHYGWINPEGELTQVNIKSIELQK